MHVLGNETWILSKRSHWNCTKHSLGCLTKIFCSDIEGEKRTDRTNCSTPLNACVWRVIGSWAYSKEWVSGIKITFLLCLLESKQGLKLWASTVQKAYSFPIGVVVWVTWADSNKHFSTYNMWALLASWVHHYSFIFSEDFLIFNSLAVANPTSKNLRSRFCASRNSGTGGGEWVHLKGADSMAMSGLCFRKTLVGTSLVPRPSCPSVRRLQY